MKTENVNDKTQNMLGSKINKQMQANKEHTENKEQQQDC